MGITRDSLHKRRLTGGKRKIHRKKRKYDLGRQPAATKIGPKRIHLVRCRGGNIKHRALRLETGNFSWATESVTRKTRILGVSYNATSNELVRTNTLVKGAIVQIDATPFKQWYEKYYGAPLGKKKKEETQATTTTTATTTTATTTTATATTKPPDKSKGTKEVEKLSRKKKKRQKMMKIEPHLEEQFNTGRLYAKITSRPGQCGRADGYILEGDELAFYLRKIMARKKAAKQ